MTATDIPVQVPERIRVQAEMQNPQRSFPASGYGSAPLEGWLQRQGSLWHYMRDGVSLCGSERQGAHHLRPHLKGGAKPCRVCAGVLAGTVKPAAPDGGKLAVLDQFNPAPYYVQTRQANGKVWRTLDTPHPTLGSAQQTLEAVRADLYPVTRLRVVRGRSENAELIGEEVSGRKRAGPKAPAKKGAAPAPTRAPEPVTYRVERLRPDASHWTTFAFGLDRAKASQIRNEQLAQHDRRFMFRVVDSQGRLQGKELHGRAEEAATDAPATDITTRIAALIEEESAGRMTDVLTELAAVKAERDALKAKLTAIQTALGGTL